MMTVFVKGCYYGNGECLWQGNFKNTKSDIKLVLLEFKTKKSYQEGNYDH